MAEPEMWVAVAFAVGDINFDVSHDMVHRDFPAVDVMQLQRRVERHLNVDARRSR